MSGFDSLKFNTRERPMSADWNDAQSLLQRMVLDSFQYFFSPSRWATASVSAESPSHVVLGGLMVSPSGTNVQVAPGALLQYSATVVPTPGALDSTYRLGVVRSAQLAVAPAPGSDTYYLLTARVKEVTASTESRDILDAGSGNFVATMVPKRVERQLEFRFEAGTATNFPLPSDFDWKVIAGVFRPAGGGSVLPQHLYDMRLLANPKTAFVSDAGVVAGWPGGLRRRSYSTGKFTSSGTQAADRFATFDVDGELQGQTVWVHCHDASSAQLAAMTTATQDPSNTPSAAAAGSWYFVYLALFAGVAPVGQGLRYFVSGSLGSPELGRSNVRGVLVESTVPPSNSSSSQGGMTNSASLSLPPPFNAQVVQARTAILVGAFRRSQANGFTPASADGSVVRLALNNQGGTATQGDLLVAEYVDNWPGGTVTVPTPAEMYPRSARQVALFLNWSNHSNEEVETFLPYQGYSNGDWASLGNASYVRTATNNRRWYMDLRLPHGTVVNSVRALIQNGNGTSPVILQFDRHDPSIVFSAVTDGAAPVPNATVTTVGSDNTTIAGPSVLIISTSETIDRAKAYRISIQSSADAATTEDRIYGIQVRCTFPATELTVLDPASDDCFVRRLVSRAQTPDQANSAGEAEFWLNVMDPADVADRLASFKVVGGKADDNVVIRMTGFTEAI